MRASMPFLEEISSFFIDAIRSIGIKNYEGVNFTGNILCKLLINSTKYMNKKAVLKVNKIFSSIFKELYEASILYHSDNYQDILE